MADQELKLSHKPKGYKNVNQSQTIIIPHTSSEEEPESLISRAYNDITFRLGVAYDYVYYWLNHSIPQNLRRNGWIN